jgi:hypothetical protein
VLTHRLHNSWLQYLKSFFNISFDAELGGAKKAEKLHSRVSADKVATRPGPAVGLAVVAIPFQARIVPTTAALALSLDCFLSTGKPDQYLLLLGPGSRIRVRLRSYCGVVLIPLHG